MKITLCQFHGDSETHSIPLSFDGADFTPGSAWTLLFTAKKSASDADTEAVIQKATSGLGITVSGSTAAVAIVPADSNAVDPGDLVWDVQAQNISTGEVHTVAIGILTLARDVTRSTAVSVPVFTTNPPVLIGTVSLDSITLALDYTPENPANKSDAIETDKASTTKYPQLKALYDWAVGKFAAIADRFPGFGSATPARLGTASVGTSATASRSDHIHPFPNAEEIGAMGDPIYPALRIDLDNGSGGINSIVLLFNGYQPGGYYNYLTNDGQCEIQALGRDVWAMRTHGTNGVWRGTGSLNPAQASWIPDPGNIDVLIAVDACEYGSQFDSAGAAASITLASLGGVPTSRTIGNVDLSVNRSLTDLGITLSALGGSPAVVLKTTAFTAAAGNTYKCDGTFAITDPSTAALDDTYTCLIVGGSVTIGGVVYTASQISKHRRYNGSGWETLANTFVNLATLSGGMSVSGTSTWTNGATFAYGTGVAAAHRTALGLGDAATHLASNFAPSSAIALSAISFGTVGATMAAAATIDAVRQALGEVIVTKSSDTSRTTTTTLATDSDFDIAVAANATYRVHFSIIVTDTSNCGIKGAFLLPSVSSLESGTVGNVGLLTNIGGSVVVMNMATSSGLVGATAMINTFATTRGRFTGYFEVTIGSTGGTLHFQWAQNTSHSDNATVCNGSHVACKQISP